MEQTTPTEVTDTTEPSVTDNGPKLTLPILIARMMQTQRDIQAYHRGEITEEEFDELGITFF